MTLRHALPGSCLSLLLSLSLAGLGQQPGQQRRQPGPREQQGPRQQSVQGSQNGLGQQPREQLGPGQQAGQGAQDGQGQRAGQGSQGRQPGQQPGLAQPQFQASIQANSPEEYDAYLEVVAAQTPESLLIAAGKFERGWPDSEMLAHVYTLQMDAYRGLGDAEGAIRAGEKAVKFGPGNIPVLVAVANLLPNGSDDPSRLARAEEYANSALLQLKTFQVPKSIRPEEWLKLESALTSQAHAALGFVAAKRKDLRTAVREYETAVSLAPAADPTQYLRLGRLYAALGRKAAAAEQFRQAAALKQSLVTALAQEELRKLESVR